MPSVASDCTSAGRAAWLAPMLKNVAGTPYCWRIERIALVVLPGPSSNVRATVLPDPGADELTPYPTAGHTAAPAAAALGAGVTWAGLAARTDCPARGPSDGPLAELCASAALPARATATDTASGNA